jgi:atypical dual specificity phosphatase
MIAVAHHHSKRHHAGSHHRVHASSVVLVACACLLLPYVLLEKKLLPRRWWEPLSRLYFYPLMVPKLLLRMASGQAYFSDVDEGVMLGATPMVIAGHVEALHRDGVRAVVNLQAEYEGPVAAYAALTPPIVQLRVPVVDHVEPTVTQLEAAVSFIAKHRARGERVLIHCKGGHGRSAAVAMAWLMSEPGGGLAPLEAQTRLSSVRKVRSRLFEQADVREFYERHRPS